MNFSYLIITKVELFYLRKLHNQDLNLRSYGFALSTAAVECSFSDMKQMRIAFAIEFSLLHFQI